MKRARHLGCPLLRAFPSHAFQSAEYRIETNHSYKASRSQGHRTDCAPCIPNLRCRLPCSTTDRAAPCLKWIERPPLRLGSSTHICLKSDCHRRSALALSLKVDKVVLFDHTSFPAALWPRRVANVSLAPTPRCATPYQRIVLLLAWTSASVDTPRLPEGRGAQLGRICWPGESALPRPALLAAKCRPNSLYSYGV